jgi:hypothetical protein
MGGAFRDQLTTAAVTLEHRARTLFGRAHLKEVVRAEGSTGSFASSRYQPLASFLR